MELIAPPPSAQTRIRPVLRSSGREGHRALSYENLTKSYDGHLLFRNLSFAVHRGERVALLGPNGTGKSTLLKIAAGQETADGGSYQIGHNVNIGYYEQDLGGLDRTCTILNEVWKSRPQMIEPDLRSYLARFLFAGEEVLRPVGSLSGGEQSRVALAKLMLLEANLLMLDEPTNHLDITSRDALERVLADYDGTLLLVSHDRFFLDKTAERILHLENGQIREYLGNYSTYREKRSIEESLRRKKKGPKKAVSRRPAGRGKASRKKLESLEEEISYLEKELEETERVLQNPELSTDWQALRTLHAQRQEISEKLDELLAEWMALGEEIES